MLHTFKKNSFGNSEFDTPIEDPKLDGCFVERIRGSDRESSIGVFKKAGARPGPRKSPGPLQRSRCLGNKKRRMWGKTKEAQIDFIHRDSKIKNATVDV